MPEVTNTERAEWAESAVAEHAEMTLSSDELVADKARDLLVGVLHLLDQEGEDPELIAQQALAMYAEEKAEDSQ